MAQALSQRILTLQGDGDYTGTSDFRATYGQMDDQLAADLERLSEAGIPVDLMYEKGLRELGL